VREIYMVDTHYSQQPYVLMWAKKQYSGIIEDIGDIQGYVQDIVRACATKIFRSQVQKNHHMFYTDISKQQAAEINIMHQRRIKLFHMIGHLIFIYPRPLHQ
jgi:hypothetical protein